MDDVGSVEAIKARDGADGSGSAKKPVAAPPPRERAQRETFGADLLAVRPHPGRHDHREARVSRGPGEGQAMRAKIPVLGHQKEELWRR